MIAKITCGLISCVLLGLLAGVTAAQSHSLTYGQLVQGVIDAKELQGFYTFNGEEGDLITIYLVGTSPAIKPTLVLLGATGQLAFSDDAPFNPMMQAAHITYRLPQTGPYNLLVGSQPGTSGTYLLYLDKLESGPAGSALNSGQPIQVPADGGTHVFRVRLDPERPLGFSMRPEPLGIPFILHILEPNGELVGVMRSPLIGTGFLLPPGDGQYEITLTFTDLHAQGTVLLVVRPAQGDLADNLERPSGAPPTDDVEPLDVTCKGTPIRGPINIRSGPSAVYSIMGQLEANGSLPVVGTYREWYAVMYQGQRGWVFASSIDLDGLCADLPTISSATRP